eukprot:1891793-Rhodomonas_salina.2
MWSRACYMWSRAHWRPQAAARIGYTHVCYIRPCEVLADHVFRGHGGFAYRGPLPPTRSPLPPTRSPLPPTRSPLPPTRCAQPPTRCPALSATCYALSGTDVRFLAYTCYLLSSTEVACGLSAYARAMRCPVRFVGSWVPRVVFSGYLEGSGLGKWRGPRNGSRVEGSGSLASLQHQSTRYLA